MNSKKLLKMKNKKHLLFVCTSNIDRSPAAESLFENSERYEAKSCGFWVDRDRIGITKELVSWSDIIFVMETEHFELLNKKFPEAKEKRIVCFGIPNDYLRYDFELLRLLKIKLEDFLE